MTSEDNDMERVVLDDEVTDRRHGAGNELVQVGFVRAHGLVKAGYFPSELFEACTKGNNWKCSH